MTVVGTDPTSEVVPVGALNQYLYCPRRYWYYRFFAPGDRSAALVEGRAKHEDQSKRPEWVVERYLRSEALGLHGRVDVLDDSDSAKGTEVSFPVPVERKRATSGQYYWNDEVQVTAYGLLVEAALEPVDSVEYGVIYLYETDERHRIPLTDDRRQAVRETRDAIREMQSGDPPSIVENRNKCRGCSVRHRCQPETEAYIERREEGFPSELEQK
jgi:CRISPR-associated exonuclease Cas4